MTDVFSKEKRSEIMSKIRSKSELEKTFVKIVAKSVRGTGYKYRLNQKLIGRPDITFPANKLAVFIDGDFWHGYKFNSRKTRLPKKYWLSKIKRNIKRDKEINKKLKSEGWVVLRIWEHEIKKNPNKAILKIIRKLAF